VLGFGTRFMATREVSGAPVRPRVAKSSQSSYGEVETESARVGEDLQGHRLTYGSHVAVAKAETSECERDRRTGPTTQQERIVGGG
jgi:hypothetical protein